MISNVVILLTALLTVLTWAIAIYLILIRRFQNQAAILKYNFWTAFLMWANLVVCLPVLFYLGGKPAFWWCRQIWLLATVTDLLATAGLIIFIAVIWTFRMQNVSNNFDYLIVLGAGLNNGKVPPVLAARLDYAVKLCRLNRQPQIIVSGGYVHNDHLSEAQAMGEYLLKQGIESNQIMYEDRAMNTWQNLRNSMELISADWRGLSAPQIIVVTSSFHVLRARSYARQLGLNLSFAAAPTPWQYQPLAVVRDYLGNIRDHRYIAIILLICELIIAEILFI